MGASQKSRGFSPCLFPSFLRKLGSQGPIHWRYFFTSSGWWCNNHLEKWWSSSMGRMTSHIWNGKIKFMFQTTNQENNLKQKITFCSHRWWKMPPWKILKGRKTSQKKPTEPLRSKPQKEYVWFNIWVWVNTYRYIFSGMNIHLPAILGFTRYQGFDPSPYHDMFWPENHPPTVVFFPHLVEGN